MWYRTGTISLINGSTAVTGSGTAWISNAAVGEALLAPDGKLYEIANIASDTSITLGSSYLGTTQSGQAYVIVPSQSYIRDLAAQAAALVNNYSTFYNTVGQGKFPDGAVATPAISFSNDTNTGLYRSAADEVTLVANGVAIAKWNTSGLSFVSGVSTITANSTSPALKITQTGTGNALVVEDSASTDSTPFVIDQNGNLVRGHTASIDITPSSPPVIQAHSASGFPFIGSTLWTNDANCTALQLAKSRANSVGAHTVVQSGDPVGRIRAYGSDGSAFIETARIEAAVDGTPGPNDMPGRLVFSTTADNSSTPTERMRIDSAGNVGIGTSSFTGYRLKVGGAATQATAGYSIGIGSENSYDPTVATVAAYNVMSSPSVATGALPLLKHFQVQQGTFTGTVTDQMGFAVAASLVGATNNYGFHSNIASGTGRWNFYAAGTASNYFAGDVLFGYPTKDSTSTVWAPYQINAGNGTGASLGQYAWNASPGACPFHTFNKSRGASVGTRGAVVSGDELGGIYFAGDDGTNFVRGVFLRALVDGTPSPGVIPGAFVISTTAVGGGSPTERLRIDSSGNVLVKSAAGLGYGAGAGGTVNQTGSRTTGVTLSKPTGSITLVSAAGSTTWQSFTVTNTVVAADDVIKVCQKSGTDKYMIHVTNVASGSFQITFATTGGTTTEQPVFNFAVIKGAVA